MNMFFHDIVLLKPPFQHYVDLSFLKLLLLLWAGVFRRSVSVSVTLLTGLRIAGSPSIMLSGGIEETVEVVVARRRFGEMSDRERSLGERWRRLLPLGMTVSCGVG